jgi:O-succinylbenzoic acid--CoA ligase
VALAEVGESRRCFVAGRPDARLGEQVTGFVEGAPLSEKDEKQLQTLLAERLGKYERPRQLVYVPAFAATASGKLDRAATLRGAVQ